MSAETASIGNVRSISDRKGATSNSRKSDSRNKQTIGGRSPKSLSRRDVKGQAEKFRNGALGDT